ncbi:hypothetical protein E2A72_17060 [Salmonella enterica]|nr:hypothetical protein [Salmonella enterica]
MPAQVAFHRDFYYGKHRSTYFCDFPMLNADPLNPNNEALFFSTFVADVKNGNLLDGKNKDSYSDSFGKELPLLIGYKASKLWHCHVGPFDYSTSYLQKKIRELNLGGLTSAAIVHYKWYDPSTKTKLIIISFSPIHTPFPGTDMKPNHLLSRGGLLFSHQIINS